MRKELRNRAFDPLVVVLALGPLCLLANAQQVFRIEGRLTAPDGQGVPGDVTLLEGTRLVRAANSPTDSQGRFAVEADPAAAWLLVAKANGYVSSEIRIRGGVAGEVLTVNFVLAPAGKVAGQVIDETGRGVPNALVRVRYPGERRFFEFGQETGPQQADDFGNFTLPFVAQGRTFVIEAWTDESLPSFSSPLILSGAPLKNVAVRLVRRGQTVRGRVRNTAGLGIPGLTVRLRAEGELEDFSAEERSSLSFVLKANQRATSGPDGSFEFKGLPAGKLILVAEDSADRRTKREAVVQRAESLTLDLTLP